MDEFNFYRYIDEKSILVITAKNKLVRVKCPFAVINVDNKISQVDAISREGSNIYYKIDGKYQIYKAFIITDKL